MKGPFPHISAAVAASSGLQVPESEHACRLQLNDWIEELCREFSDAFGRKRITVLLDPQLTTVSCHRERLRCALAIFLVRILERTPRERHILLRTERTSDRKRVRISVGGESFVETVPDPAKGAAAECSAGALPQHADAGSADLTDEWCGMAYVRHLAAHDNGRAGWCETPGRERSYYIELPLHEETRQEPGPAMKKRPSPVDVRFVKRVHRTVMEHLDDPQLDIPRLCTLIGTSRASLYNKLKASVGVGANEYLNRIRIEQATAMIRETPLSITEISEKVGFSSPKYFSTCFRRHTGLTPTQCRKRD